MKIAIHHRKKGFSGKWIEYCKKNNIDYKIVNCFDTDIIDQLKYCDGLMWHWPHTDLKAKLFARQLTYSLEKKGIKVFPDSKTCWHYDDKVGQKYLLEAVDSPLVPSYVFYDKQKALEWAGTTEFPKVFKTRNGAGSQNVRLIKNKREALRIIEKAFGKGIRSYDKYGMVKESFWKFQRDKTFESIGRIAKYLLKLPLSARFQPEHTVEKGYLYFQDFIPQNKFDIRVVVIGDRAFAIKRFVREGGFKASGSGNFSYAKNEIPEETIELGFQINSKLNAQSIAYDFIYDPKNEKYVVVEISYAYSVKAYYDCPGYWDVELTWHEGEFYPEYFMIEDFIKELNI